MKEWCEGVNACEVVNEKGTWFWLKAKWQWYVRRRCVITAKSCRMCRCDGKHEGGHSAEQRRRQMTRRRKKEERGDVCMKVMDPWVCEGVKAGEVEGGRCEVMYEHERQNLCTESKKRKKGKGGKGEKGRKWGCKAMRKGHKNTAVYCEERGKRQLWHDPEMRVSKSEMNTPAAHARQTRTWKYGLYAWYCCWKEDGMRQKGDWVCEYQLCHMSWWCVTLDVMEEFFACVMVWMCCAWLWKVCIWDARCSDEACFPQFVKMC